MPVLYRRIRKAQGNWPRVPQYSNIKVPEVRPRSKITVRARDFRFRRTFAVFSGSSSSGGAGVRAVLMAQNWHPRVHVSPAKPAPQNVNDR